MVRARRILGSIMGLTRLGVDIPRLIGLYRAKRLKLDESMTARYPFEQIIDAIDASEQDDALRNLVFISATL